MRFGGLDVCHVPAVRDRSCHVGSSTIHEVLPHRSSVHAAPWRCYLPPPPPRCSPPPRPSRRGVRAPHRAASPPTNVAVAAPGRCSEAGVTVAQCTYTPPPPPLPAATLPVAAIHGLRLVPISALPALTPREHCSRHSGQAFACIQRNIMASITLTERHCFCRWSKQVVATER
jgi:hypothetical protein